MLSTLQGVTLLTIMEVVGPVLLAVVMAWAIFYARGRAPSQRARTDAATERLYDEEEGFRQDQHEV
jgi:hypothetical protein